MKRWLPTAVRAASGFPGRLGFTLVELLVVMAIIGVLLTLITPAVTSVLRGTELTRGGNLASDIVGSARQQAAANNRDVYVLFYKLPNSTGTLAWRGMQLAYLNRTVSPPAGDTGPAVTPIGKVVLLPDSVEFSTAIFSSGQSFSPLLTSPSVSGTRALNNYSTPAHVTWQGFRFRADGALDRAIDPTSAYLTVVSSVDNGTAPKNYYTVQVNSFTGMVRSFRP